ncbi:hypothetical protein H310_01385 [Aphanomyces invadans]|uniref:JmjC domain-containing protein n=1 Tax=Aphanomyces invadans TaxID=157072 RepID=A0A024USM4_9STRA|nr:hypothetical protein H310_01385 [Aphanomyces invadans]ETW08892.1 hypothetical protein H310_01385 [Aphanomyces invadans]|eukprot:XP_008862697.1 hypothetical protein H310_01385 [Aphanomyces invadans]
MRGSGDVRGRGMGRGGRGGGRGGSRSTSQCDSTPGCPLDSEVSSDESDESSSSSESSSPRRRPPAATSRSGRPIRPVSYPETDQDVFDDHMLRLDMERRAKEAGYEEMAPVAPARVFYPSVEEFANPIAYLNYVAKEGARYGIAKIVPPKGWAPPHMIHYDNNTNVFETKLQKVHRLREGKSYRDGKDHTLHSYRKAAHEFKAAWFARKGIDPVTWTDRDFEKEYWKVVETSYESLEVEYANDLDISIVGSGFPQVARDARRDDPHEHVDFSSRAYYDHTAWNLNNLPSARGSLLRHIDAQINGVNVPWVYFGMLFASFCWHFEDNSLYSANYMHTGAKKHWYGIPAASCDKFEAVWKSLTPDRFAKKPDLFFHLVTMVSPTVLRQHDVDVYSLIQEPGDIVVTFPQGYHCGFSQGFNCNEAVNFCLPDWIPFGRVCSERYREVGRLSVFSHDRFMSVLAKRGLFPDDADHDDDVGALVQASRMLMDELNRLVDEEIRLRDQLVKSGIVTVVAMTKRNEALTDDEMGYDDRRQCVACKHSLFFSGIACSCSHTKVACLRHADKLCQCDPSKKVFLQWFTLLEMFGSMEALDVRLVALEKRAATQESRRAAKRVKVDQDHHVASCRTTLERNNQPSMAGSFSLTVCTGAGLTGALFVESEHASEVALLTSEWIAACEASRETRVEKHEELNATRLMQTQPSFPHMLVLPPQDDPDTVISKVLEGGTRMDLGNLFPPTLSAPPSSHSLRHAWVRALHCLRSIQYLVESGFDDAAYLSKIRAHQRTVVTSALQRVREFDVVGSMALFIAVNRKDLVEGWDATEVDHMHLWFQRLCSNHLAHVVWLTDLPRVIREVIVDRSQNDVCLLVRPQSGSFDQTDASTKLSLLLATYQLDLSDDERALILASMGNSWTDLQAVCAAIAERSVDVSCSEVNGHRVHQAIELYKANVADALRFFLHLDVLAEADKPTQIGAIEKWTVFQRLCGLGSDLQLLAGPHALVKRETRPVVDVVSVLECFASSGSTGDQRFWDMVAGEWIHLEPQTDLAIGVVPCPPVDLCRSSHVVLRPVVEAAFRNLWMDEHTWKQMHDLQHRLDVDMLYDQLSEYEADIVDAAAAVETKRRAVELAWDAYTEAEKSEHLANLHLAELKLQLQRDHVQRLRLVYQTTQHGNET